MIYVQVQTPAGLMTYPLYGIEGLADGVRVATQGLCSYWGVSALNFPMKITRSEDYV